jgi:HEAT repeats
MSHSGYFWLSYEWYNLLLSCRNCNSAHTYVDAAGNPCTHPGKAREFRITGTRVDTPLPSAEGWFSDLEREDPLLLNPYFDDPEEHIGFNNLGYPIPLTERGRETIAVCHLDRIDLVEARWEARKNLCYQINKALFASLDQSSTDPFFAGDAEYSAWLNSCVQDLLGSWMKRRGLSVVKSRQDRQRDSWNEAWQLAVAPLNQLEQFSDSCELSAAFFAVIRAIPPELKANPLGCMWFQEQALTCNRWAIRCAAIGELMVRRNDWPLTINTLLKCIKADSHPAVRGAALFALVRNWKDDPETLPILKACARSDESLALRQVAVQQLVREWKDDPEVQKFVA